MERLLSWNVQSMERLLSWNVQSMERLLPWNVQFMERLVHGMFVFMERLVHGLFVIMKRLVHGTFVIMERLLSWNVQPMDRLFHGTFGPYSVLFLGGFVSNRMLCPNIGRYVAYYILSIGLYLPEDVVFCSYNIMCHTMFLHALDVWQLYNTAQQNMLSYGDAFFVFLHSIRTLARKHEEQKRI